MLRKALDKYKKLPITVKASLWFLVCSMLQKAFSLITTPVFTRLMSTEEYGQFSIYNSWLQIFTILTSLRLSWAVFNKGMSKYRDDRDTYTCTMQLTTTFLTSVFFLLYLVFRKPINELTELPTFIMVAMFIEMYSTSAIDFWTTRKRYEYIYKPVVFRTLGMTVCNLFVGIAAVYFSNDKGIARILSVVVVSTVFGLPIYVYNIRKSRKLFVKEYAKFAILFNLPLLLHYFSQYVLDQFDRIMIQKMVGGTAVALYSVSYNAGLIMRIVTQSINNAFVPWQYEQLEKKRWKKLDDTIFAIFILVAAVSVMFSACAPEIIKILADEKYHEAVNVVPPVALGMFFSFAYTIFANVEFYFEQNKFTMYISMCGAALNVIMNYIGIKQFGYVAAAYTTLFCYVIFCVTHYVYMNFCVKKYLGVKNAFNTKRLAILMLAILSFGLLVISLYNYVLIRFTIIILILLVVWLRRNKIKEVIVTIK